MKYQIEILTRAADSWLSAEREADEVEAVVDDLVQMLQEADRRGPWAFYRMECQSGQTALVRLDQIDAFEIKPVEE